MQNGVHYASNSQYPYHVGDSTRSAEAWRVIANTVRGNTLLSVGATFPNPNRQVQPLYRELRYGLNLKL